MASRITAKQTGKDKPGEKKKRQIMMQDYETNYDLMTKDALSAFQDDIMDFFEISGKSVGVPISVEAARAEVAHVIGDMGFAAVIPASDPVSGDGQDEGGEAGEPANDPNREYAMGLMCEFEVGISIEDIRRFRLYVSMLSEKYKCEFLMYIITLHPSPHESLSSPHIDFHPAIIRLYEWDEAQVLFEIEQKVNSGESVNALKLIYYPLCGKSKDYLNKALEAFKIVSVAFGEKNDRTRVASMITLGVIKFLSKEEAIIRSYG
jgi:hypothetical protein